MKELLNDNLQFRWDILHLANRAHVDARGTTAADLKEAAKFSHLEEDGEVETPAATLSATPISELIDMIQKSAKTLRTGIQYTGLKISSQSFKRPKVWSATRMCLYEYDMVKRFLENRVF